LRKKIWAILASKKALILRAKRDNPEERASQGRPDPEGP